MICRLEPFLNRWDIGKAAGREEVWPRWLEGVGAEGGECLVGESWEGLPCWRCCRRVAADRRDIVEGLPCDARKYDHQ